MKIQRNLIHVLLGLFRIIQITIKFGTELCNVFGVMTNITINHEFLKLVVFCFLFPIWKKKTADNLIPFSAWSNKWPFIFVYICCITSAFSQSSKSTFLDKRLVILHIMVFSSVFFFFFAKSLLHFARYLPISYLVNSNLLL